MTGLVVALRRLFTTGLPAIHSEREIGDYLLAARLRDRAAVVYARRPAPLHGDPARKQNDDGRDGENT